MTTPDYEADSSSASRLQQEGDSDQSLLEMQKYATPPGSPTHIGKKSFFFIYNPAGKIAENAVWRSAFWTIWHCILNADSAKTHSSSVTF